MMKSYFFRILNAFFGIQIIQIDVSDHLSDLNAIENINRKGYSDLLDKRVVPEFED